MAGTAVALMLAGTLAAPSVQGAAESGASPAARAGTGCRPEASAMPSPAGDDARIARRTAAYGVPLAVAGRCAAVTLLVSPVVDSTARDDYWQGATRAYEQLVATSGTLPARTVRIFVIDGPIARARAFAALHPMLRELPDVVRDAAGFNYEGDVWLDARRLLASAARVETAAHEVAHVFVHAAAGGGPLPAWLDEGIAVATGDTVTAGLLPAGPDAPSAGEERLSRLLTAAGKRGPLPLLPLDALVAERAWQLNMAHASTQSLQYDEAYAAVSWLQERYGTGAVWDAVREIGRRSKAPRLSWIDALARHVRFGMPAAGAALDPSGTQPGVERAFQRTFGLSPAALDQQLRDEWAAGAAAPPPTRVQITIDPAGATDQTWISVAVDSAAGTRRAFANGVRPGTYELAVAGEAIADPSGRLALHDDQVDAGPIFGAGRLLLVQIGNPRYGGADGESAGGAEALAFRQSGRRWMPNGQRLFVPAHGEPQSLAGSAGERFPDGNAIRLTPESNAP